MKRSLRSWLWGIEITQEVEEELAFHVEMRTRELVEKGIDARIAREMVLLWTPRCWAMSLIVGPVDAGLLRAMLAMLYIARSRATGCMT